MSGSHFIIDVVFYDRICIMSPNRSVGVISLTFIGAISLLSGCLCLAVGAFAGIHLIVVGAGEIIFGTFCFVSASSVSTQDHRTPLICGVGLLLAGTVIVGVACVSCINSTHDMAALSFFCPLFSVSILGFVCLLHELFHPHRNGCSK